MSFGIGEKLHVIEKRLFVDDVRRHFIGEVITFNQNSVRLKGYTWVYSSREGKFFKRAEKRERIIILGDRIIINVIPKETIIEDVQYLIDTKNRLLVSDRKNFSLDLSEFVESH